MSYLKGHKTSKTQKKRQDYFIRYNEVINLFEGYIKVMRGYLTSYIKESPFVLFRDGASNS